MANTQAGARHADAFVGREVELAELRGYADKAAAGEPWLVVVEGAPGIGKSVLVRRLAAALEGFTVLRAQADRSETDFPYGVIGQVVARADSRVLKRFPLLAGGLTGAVTPYTVGAELLVLLGEVQQDGPVAVVVDDVQWADQPSTRTLAFVLRRLWADRVLTVLVTRPGGLDEVLDRAAEGERAVRLSLDGMGLDEVAQLTRQITGVEPPPALVEELRERTGGHPLYVRTLLAELPPEAVASGKMGEELPVPPSLWQGIQAQLEHLPSSSRRLLEALAVLDARVTLVTAAQLAGIDDPAQALGPAVDAGLVRWWSDGPTSQVRISHDLQRQAVYHAMSHQRRQEQHAAAAVLVDATSALAHRVAAAASTDPALAADLEQAATTESATARHALAATHLLWASTLSGNRADHERRLLTACAQSLLTLRPTWAASHRDQVTACTPSPLRSCVLGIMDTLEGHLRAGKDTLDEAFSQAQATPETGWIAVLASTFLALLHCWSGDGKQTVAVARRALEIGGLDPASSDFTRTLMIIGYFFGDTGQGIADELAHLPTAPHDVPDHHLDTLAARGAYRLALDDPAAAMEDLNVVLHRQRAGAAPKTGMWAYTLLARAHYLLGDWDEAVALADQALTTAATHEQVWYDTHFSALCVPAGRGDWQQAQAHLDALDHLVKTVGTRVDILFAALGGAVIAQARADHQAMLQALLLAVDQRTAAPGKGWNIPPYYPLRSWQQRLMIEALTGCGHLQDAHQALEAFRNDATDSALPHVIEAFLAGRLAEAESQPEQALDHFQRGTQIPQDANDPVLYRGMLEHAYGRLLHTTGKASRREAATWLTTAAGRFTALKATPFLQRCNADLAATGLQAPQARPDELTALTERESAVAHRAAKGLTNQETARELFMSQKTVEYHLSHIYAKLGITSRRQLATALQTAA